MKKPKKISMNIGIISFLTVFVILCLVTFAVLSLASAKSNVNLTEKSIQHKTEYYQLCNQGETYLKKIDDILYQNYSQGQSENAYFALLHKVKSIDSQMKINGHTIEFDIVQNSQRLHVELEVIYPGKTFYQLKVWDIGSSKDWAPDNKINIL